MNSLLFLEGLANQSLWVRMRVGHSLNAFPGYISQRCIIFTAVTFWQLVCRISPIHVISKNRPKTNNKACNTIYKRQQEQGGRQESATAHRTPPSTPRHHHLPLSATTTNGFYIQCDKCCALGLSSIVCPALVSGGITKTEQ